MGKMYDVIFW